MEIRLCLLMSVLAAGCETSIESTAADQTRKEAVEVRTEQAVVEPPPEPDAPLDEQLSWLAKRYAPGMKTTTPAFRGELAEGERQDFLAVLRSGRCYKILGVADSGVSDLDLFLFDPQGVPTQQDMGEDRYPTLGLHSTICPRQSGSYRVQARMYKGAGHFAARVYHSINL